MIFWAPSIRRSLQKHPLGKRIIPIIFLFYWGVTLMHHTGIIKWSAAVLAGLILFPLLQAHADEPLDIGIFPRRSMDVTRSMFTPLAEYLQSKLERKVVLHTAYDYRAFWKLLEGRQLDLVHFNQYHYVRSRKEAGYRVIAKNREFGTVNMRAVIMVRRDGEIKTLEDLKGGKIIFGGGRDAMISYIAPTYLLRRAGLMPGDYMEGFALNPPQGLTSVYYLQGDAAAVGHVVPDLLERKNKLDIGELREIASSQELTQLPWAVSPDLSADMLDRVRELLLNLDKNPEGRKVLKSMDIDSLEPASDRSYDVHRRIIADVLGEAY